MIRLLRTGHTTAPPRAQLEWYFFLGDHDKALVAKHRGDHSRLGFALQVVTARYLGMFLADPLDVPGEVLDHVAEQLAIADPSCVKRYTDDRSLTPDFVPPVRRATAYRRPAPAR